MGVGGGNTFITPEQVFGLFGIAFGATYRR
jgi:hypothetical protein